MAILQNSLFHNVVVDYHLAVAIGTRLLSRSICDAPINNVFQPTQLKFELLAEILCVILHSNAIT
jgi:hypothetical protein